MKIILRKPLGFAAITALCLVMVALFARAHIIIKIDASLSEKFKENNNSVLSSGMADADLIDTIDSLSYNLIK